MAPDTLNAVLDTIREVWPLSADCEISMEANPTSVEAGKFREFSQAGVNRLSMGIQSLIDSDLKSLGRLHTAKEARDAFDIARATFDRISFDLIYSRQNQSMADWEAELSEALEMAVDHLSLYQLTIEQGTRFYDLRKMGKLRGLPDSDLSADMYLRTQDICENANMPAYEVSNHAKAGSESRHNLIYWRYGDYIGVGPGAHGRITLDGQKYSTETHLMPDTWLNAVAEHSTGELDHEIIKGTDSAAEYLMMSLRLNEGTNLARYKALSGHDLDSAKISEMIDSGLLKRDNHSISTTPNGRLLLNAVLRNLLVDEAENA